MKKQNTKIITLALGFIFLGVVAPLLMVINIGRVLALPLTPPITPPFTPPISVTPTPTPSRGAYKLVLNPNVTSIVCTKGDPNCYLKNVLVVYNNINQKLYNTTFYTSNYKGMLSYIGFGGGLTTGTSTTTKVFEPGQEVINTLVKVTPPNEVGTYYATLYIDGKTCNPATTPPDCYYYGASNVTFVVKVVDAIPLPTSTPTPTNIPTPTPTVVIPTKTPTPTPKKNRNPVFITNYLPAGKLNRPYHANIVATDPDGDRIKMTAYYVPQGLKFGYISGPGKSIGLITGNPQKLGPQNIYIRIEDGKGAVAAKNFWFIVTR